MFTKKKKRALATFTAAALLSSIAVPYVVEAAEPTTRQSISYSMVADPNGPMAEFITNYLNPYFSNAQHVVIDGKSFIELTLTEKAYGFSQLQYADATGKFVDIDVVSSTGEKLEQVRVVRLPLVQHENGITKIFVNSGELGYGAYTLFFTFNVQKVEAPSQINPFTDIDTLYSKDNILALYAAGITTGTTATTFSPNANVTRSQFAVMIARALGVTSNNPTPFTDVQNKWFIKEVQALAELGIVTGATATTFQPGNNVTRQQAATILYRMLKHKGYKSTTTAASLTFNDAAQISDYAKEAIAELQEKDIMTGSNGYVNPKANLTRAQMAKLLKNTADLVGLLD